MDCKTDVLLSSHIEKNHGDTVTMDRTFDPLPDSAIVYISIFMTVLVMSFVIFCLQMANLGQKTQSPQRRMYVGRSAAQSSQEPSEPTIFLSPSNLPPPPKYELMAPPSYEEVIGTNYPYSASTNQPISQPIVVALQNSDIAPVHTPPNYQTAIQINSENNATNNEHVTVVTVSNERRSSAPVVA